MSASRAGIVASASSGSDNRPQVVVSRLRFCYGVLNSFVTWSIQGKNEPPAPEDTPPVITRRKLALALVPLVIAVAAGMSACTPATPGGQTAVNAARTQIGQPYVSGGESRAEGGFDCSGLTLWAWQQAKVTGMPRTASGQYAWAQRITKAELAPGDLVFYSSAGPTGTVSHVALYSGQGTIIQAHKTGTRLGEDQLEGYWAGHLVGYGRVPASAVPAR